MNVDQPLQSPEGSEIGAGYIDPSTLTDEERRIARELATALETTTYEIRDPMSELMPGLYLGDGRGAWLLAAAGGAGACMSVVLARSTGGWMQEGSIDSS
jgi:hypothetical protein